MYVALLQLNASDLPDENLPVILEYIQEAADQGAQFILTPEVTNCVSSSRDHQLSVFAFEEDDQTLKAIQAQAKSLAVWVSIGSLGLKTDDPDGRFANRSFLISPKGEIVARYDKIHMFDVDLDKEETYRESAGYRPGSQAVAAETDFAKIGMTICYDLRFPYLHRALALKGAEILIGPSAFSPVSGKAHWEVLLRARAIETGCFVIAAAQCGTHHATKGRARQTYGHSLVVSPWGEVLLDGGTEPGVKIVDIDLGDIAIARKRIPSLSNGQEFAGPE